MPDTLEVFGKEYRNVAGFKAKDNNGITLTYTRGGSGSGALVDVTTTLANGGTAHSISGLDISGDTVNAAHLASGYTAHDNMGNAITGTMPSNQELAESIITGTITSYVNNNITNLRSGAFSNCPSLTQCICHNVTAGAGNSFQNCTNLKKLAFPRYVNSGYGFNNNNTIEEVDFTDINSLATNFFNNCSSLTTIVLRYRVGLVALTNVNVFSNTPFKSGGTGGTIYIPKILYDHLGDGTALDYKAATNWSTVDGYGTITWAQIEGSIYETKYADGTDVED